MTKHRGKGTEDQTASESSDPQIEVDRLFELPLAEFTGARNALAARLKRSGENHEAERVKALAKPSISVWAVNQLYWKHRSEFAALMEAGRRFRELQASQLAGKTSDVAASSEARRKAVADLLRLAATVLEEGGHSATTETMRRITTTLEALSAYASLPDGPAPGRLTEDLDPPGFDALAMLMPKGGSVHPFPVPPRRPEPPPVEIRRTKEPLENKVAAAKIALRDAERALRETRSDAEKVHASLKKAEAVAREAEQEKREAEERFRKASVATDEAHRRVRSATAEAEQAARSLQQATRKVEQAEAELESLLRTS
jgi:hypothetical protein